jgi:hypothetical protein
MAKNYAALYNNTGVSTALEQRFYIKQETTKAELIAPTDADFFYTLPGGSVEFTQPFESSPHRSGRHHLDKIMKKKECSWSIPTYFNIDTALGSPGVAEIDPAIRALFLSLCGVEDTTTGIKFTIGTPDTSFSVFEVGDRMAKQTRGGFVQAATLNFPGDGEANAEWTGNAKDTIYVGMGKSTANNSGGNTVTLVTGDGAQFLKSIGGLVMLIEADGLTRSADTPNGSPRKITNVVGDVITLDGSALADADGSGLNAPVYLTYYEPATPTAINDPQTGLTGSMTISGLSSFCARNISLTIANDHELINYCYGKDSLSDQLFVPGTRLTAGIEFEANLDKNMFKFFQKLQNFESQVLEIILGSATGRRLDIDIPRAFFEVPAIPYPESGSVPITFSGICYQTVLDAADEISLHFK